MSANFEKSTDYYAYVRNDILPLLNVRWQRLLDVGCGQGATARYLREKGFVQWVGGIEITDAAAEAARHLDQVLHCPVEEALAGDLLPQADLVLCLDVLEHLVDPWTVLRQLVARMPAGATFIVSIPNIRYYKVLYDLLLRGKFTYTAEGVLDSTHLRFFTRSTATALLTQAGLDIEETRQSLHVKPWKNKWFLYKLTGGLIGDFYTPQYLFRARKG